ncbi:MAG TPA: hypothetical protein VIH78_05290 [Terriglobales bacterium]
MTAKTTAAPLDRSAARVAGISFLVSFFSFLHYLQRGDLLLYGDAVAHINIARRVFDSLTPGPLQLGTVWLPLPHVLMIPFIFSNAMWQNGSGGSISSMIAYGFGVVGIFSLLRGALDSDPRTKPGAVIGAAAAAIAYGANPNLIYMQSTAMTESLYLALFIWSVAYFAEFVRSMKETASEKVDSGRTRSMRKALFRCACCLAAAELTRYDGWFLASVMGSAIVIIALRRWENRALRRVAIKFLLIIAVAPALWLAYNRVIYGSALDFATGPYSARAIEQRVGAPNPALHSPPVAAVYFLKAAQLNLADGNWGRFWLAGAFVALVFAAWKLRAQLPPLLLLWSPLPFYALSIAYGSVPLHVSTWWPFATFNQRYGLQLLPMFAASMGLLTGSIYVLLTRETSESSSAGAQHGWKLVSVLLVMVVVSYALVWKSGPQCLQEAQKNWRIRNPLNSAVERVVTHLPRNSMYLMDLGEHVGVMEQADVPLRQVVNQDNHRPWKHPSDPEGLWERALADPTRHVDFVIAFDGDAVDQGVNKTNLTELTEIHATGQAHAHIYATRLAPNQSR